MGDATAVRATIAGLREGAARLVTTPPQDRAALAEATARSVATQADAWAEASATIEQPAGGEPSRGLARGILAEELATGPLVTLRLLRVTAAAWRQIAAEGRPRLPSRPRLAHPGAVGGRLAGHGEPHAPRVAIDVVPTPGLFDPLIFAGVKATVRTAGPADLGAFERVRHEEVRRRPATGGVAVVLGAGNVSGLAASDAICQIFEHGRAAWLKLHPLHAPLVGILAEAARPLVEAGLLAISIGGPELVETAVACEGVSQVHLTGGRGAYEAIRGLLASTGRPIPISCELGNVTPWIVVPGDYTPRQLAMQADMIAGSIINNASFNCIATKVVVTCRGWPGREALLARIASRLAAAPRRWAWYPGAAAAFEERTGRPPPDDGRLPWLFETGIDAARDRRLIDREWFLPACVEIPLKADSLDRFCGAAAELAGSLPGSLAANLTFPECGDARDRQRAELLAEHLGYGVVAVNTWSALAYSMACVPWGGLPGSTAENPQSGIGHVHDPLLLPLVHDTILRGPLCPRLPPAWLPWHPAADRLAAGLLRLYGTTNPLRHAWELARMLPDVLR